AEKPIHIHIQHLCNLMRRGCNGRSSLSVDNVVQGRKLIPCKDVDPDEHKISRRRQTSLRNILPVPDPVAVRKLGKPIHISSTAVCPVKAGMFSRGKACRGKNQRPRSLDSRVAGNQDSEAYRQRLPRGDDESPGRNESKRECGLENE